jgi:hypothetical protein
VDFYPPCAIIGVGKVVKVCAPRGGERKFVREEEGGVCKRGGLSQDDTFPEAA